MKLSIVMPVYNEKDVIKQTIEEVEKWVKTPHELLIVYDMDEDTTVPPVKKLQKKYPSVKLVKNAFGGGALNALKTGLNKAKGSAICIMMSDLTDDPKILGKMMEKFNEGYDVIAASRYMLVKSLASSAETASELFTSIPKPLKKLAAFEELVLSVPPII